MVTQFSNLKDTIFVRLLVALLAGITVAILLPFSFTTTGLLFFLAFCLTICILTVYMNFSYQNRWLYGMVLGLCIFCIGFCLFQLQKNSLCFQEIPEQKTTTILKIIETGEDKPNTTKYLTKVMASTENKLKNEPVIIYLASEIKKQFPKGSIWYVSQYLQRIQKPKNPHQFNYQAYMDKKGIHYQAYISKDQFIGFELPKQSKKDFLEGLRAYCFQFINTHITKQNKGVAKALLLGYKKELKDITSEQFQRSGTMHILAVSGLHVGIIYLLLQTILSVFKSKSRLSKIFQLVIMIGGIWLFALLTGARASVIRAACMFSLFALGRFAFPYWNSINVLAAVAFFMLIIKPNYLTDVGFQMSFCAVLGILLFIPFMKFFYTSSKFLNYFIGILFISLVAQLATLPFVLLYFHQFPTVGLLANLIAIPLTFAIVFIGFIGFVIAKIPMVSDVMGFTLNVLLSILNGSNEFFSNLKFAVVDSIYITPFQAVGIGLILLLLVMYMRTNVKKLFWACLTFSFILVLSVSLNKLKSSQQNKIILYSTNEGVIIDHIQNRKSTLFTTKTIDSTEFKYTIQPNHLANYVKDRRVIFLNKKDSAQGNQFIWNGNQLLIGETSFDFQKKLNWNSSADFVLTEQVNNIQWNEKPSYNQQIIVFNRYKPSWIKASKQVYFLREQGAYQIK